MALRKDIAAAAARHTGGARYEAAKATAPDIMAHSRGKYTMRRRTGDKEWATPRDGGRRRLPNFDRWLWHDPTKQIPPRAFRLERTPSGTTTNAIPPRNDRARPAFRCAYGMRWWRRQGRADLYSRWIRIR